MPEQTDARIVLDKSACSIVVCCTGCPWWRGFALDRIEGWQVGARHQSMHHPGTKQASTQLAIARATRRN